MNCLSAARPEQHSTPSRLPLRGAKARRTPYNLNNTLLADQSQQKAVDRSPAAGSAAAHPGVAATLVPPVTGSAVMVRPTCRRRMNPCQINGSGVAASPVRLPRHRRIRGTAGLLKRLDVDGGTRSQYPPRAAPYLACSVSSIVLAYFFVLKPFSCGVALSTSHERVAPDRLSERTRERSPGSCA